MRVFESADAQDRVRETLRLMKSLGSWANEMLRLTPSTLDNVLQLGEGSATRARQQQARLRSFLAGT